MAKPSAPDGRGFDGPVQQLINAEILGVTLPLLLGVSVVGLGIGLASFGENPYRVFAGAVGTGCCSAAWVFHRRGQSDRAVQFLVGALVAVPCFAMGFNGGLRAPAAAVLLVLVSMVGWFYGRRAATRAAWFATVFAVLVAGLSALGVLRAAEPPPPLTHAAFFALYVWLIWIATAYPQTRLRASLTEVVAREEALKHAELAFRAVFERTIHPMMLVSPAGEVLRANHAAAGFADAARWPLALSVPVAQARAQPARPDDDPVRCEVSIEAPHRRFEFTVTPFFDDGGRLGYWILEGRDVTALLAHEERESRARRLALVGQLAAGIAHDFNNALAAIVGSAEVLRAELSSTDTLTPPAAENIDAIVSVGMRASALSRRLLTFGAQAPLVKHQQSLHALLKSTLALLHRTLPAHIIVQTHLDAAEDLVDVDEASVESILLNLAINARDAMPQGGTLTVSTEATDRGCVRVSVADTGTGIAPEIRDRLFEPFFTTKVRGQGTGVGLASVFGAMASHGGSVDLRTEVGRGTTFFLDFPLVPRPP